MIYTKLIYSALSCTVTAVLVVLGIMSSKLIVRHIIVMDLSCCNRYSINSRAHKHVKRQCSPTTSGADIGGDDTSIVVRREYYNSYNS